MGGVASAERVAVIAMPIMTGRFITGGGAGGPWPLEIGVGPRVRPRLTGRGLPPGVRSRRFLGIAVPTYPVSAKTGYKILGIRIHGRVRVTVITVVTNVVTRKI